jgi:hypothetical protein
VQGHEGEVKFTKKWGSFVNKNKKSVDYEKKQKVAYI